MANSADPDRGLDGLVVRALDFQAGYHGFESRSDRDNFQTISMPNLVILDVPWVEYKVDRAGLGDRQRHQVCMGDPWKQGCTNIWT